MTNEEKIRQIRVEKLRVLAGYGVWMDCVDIDTILREMAEWKDQQIHLIIDAIDHAYLQTDGTYGELSYEVSDQVKYLKNQLKGK